MQMALKASPTFKGSYPLRMHNAVGFLEYFLEC